MIECSGKWCPQINGKTHVCRDVAAYTYTPNRHFFQLKIHRLRLHNIVVRSIQNNNKKWFSATNAKVCATPTTSAHRQSIYAVAGSHSEAENRMAKHQLPAVTNRRIFFRFDRTIILQIWISKSERNIPNWYCAPRTPPPLRIVTPYHSAIRWKTFIHTHTHENTKIE